VPMYCYVCPECGRRLEVMRSIQGRDDPVTCECGTPARRDFTSELPNATGTQRGDTFWSESLAISPDQTAEHRRFFPNVQVDREGRLGFDSVRERSDYLDRCGFDKKPGKPKRTGTRYLRLPTPAKAGS
jgi:putative FmdB family regulatory protein